MQQLAYVHPMLQVQLLLMTFSNTLADSQVSNCILFRILRSFLDDVTYLFLQSVTLFLTCAQFLKIAYSYTVNGIVPGRWIHCK